MLLNFNYRFIKFSIIMKLYITKANLYSVHKDVALIRRFNGPTYVATANQICKDHYYIKPDI